MEQSLSQDFSSNHFISVQYLFWFQKGFLQSSLIQISSSYLKLRSSVWEIALWLQAILYSWDFGISSRIYVCDNISPWKSPQEIYQKENQENSSFLCQPVGKESGSIHFLARNSYTNYLPNQWTFSIPEKWGTPPDLQWNVCLQDIELSPEACAQKGKKYPISTTAETRLLFPGQAFGILTFPQALSVFPFALTSFFAEDFKTEKNLKSI